MIEEGGPRILSDRFRRADCGNSSRSYRGGSVLQWSMAAAEITWSNQKLLAGADAASGLLPSSVLRIGVPITKARAYWCGHIRSNRPSPLLIQMTTSSG